jgi:hypothetical protein
VEVHRESKVSLAPLFLTAVLNGVKFSNSRYDRFVPENEPALHRKHKAGWACTPYGRLWEKKNSSTMPGIDPRLV